MTSVKGWFEEKIKNGKSQYESDEVNDDIIKELELLREVDYHPRINRCLGITKDPKNYILVLEYANEENLRTYLKKNFTSLKWTDKIQMALDITSGLKFLHAKGIIHRDLHSKNILVNDRKLLIADLGLSKKLAETTTQSMGPILKNKSKVDDDDDLYIHSDLNSRIPLEVIENISNIFEEVDKVVEAAEHYKRTSDQDDLTKYIHISEGQPDQSDHSSRANLSSLDSDDNDVRLDESLRPSDICINFPVAEITFTADLPESFSNFMNNDEGKLYETLGHLFPIRILIGDKIQENNLSELKEELINESIEKCKKEISLIHDLNRKLMDNI
ncbi:unnamed protein product [Rhizophagus irregularis]|nr:unnamed protein product [Rhizophagus irregularis]